MSTRRVIHAAITLLRIVPDKIVWVTENSTPQRQRSAIRIYTFWSIFFDLTHFVPGAHNKCQSWESVSFGPLPYGRIVVFFF